MASTRTRDEAKAKFQDTRQLLDELDALMDQMLALPINDQNDNESAASQAPATVSATLTMLGPSTAPTEMQGLHQNQQQSDTLINVDQPNSEAGAGNYQTSLESSDETIAVPVLGDVAAPPMVELAPLPGPVAGPRWRPDHISYQFLLWINQGYDGGTRWLGKPGTLLRSRASKALLGCAGLGLLGVAAAWLARDLLGWN